MKNRIIQEMIRCAERDVDRLNEEDGRDGDADELREGYESDMKALGSQMSVASRELKDLAKMTADLRKKGYDDSYLSKSRERGYRKVADDLFDGARDLENADLSESEEDHVAGPGKLMIYPEDLRVFHTVAYGPRGAENLYDVAGKPKSRGGVVTVPIRDFRGKKGIVDLPSKEKVAAYTRRNLGEVFKTKSVDPSVLKPGDRVLWKFPWGDAISRVTKKSAVAPSVLARGGMSVEVYGVFIIGHPDNVGKNADRTFLHGEQVLRIVGER